MAVDLTISETYEGAQVADSLAGGGSGVDLGSVTNGSYAPVISKPSNTGAKTLYVFHDAADDPITSTKIFIQQYGTGTGYTYGGADTAANDMTTLTGYGNTSTEAASDKNNSNGTSAGFWIDMDYDVSTASQFDPTATTTTKIFGNGGTDGISLGSAFTIAAQAMIKNVAEDAPSAAVAGQIGKNGDAVLGDAAKLKFRIYLPSSATNGGIIQWETVIAYSYTS